MADMMQESLMATPVIQSLGREAHAVRAFAKNNRRSARADLRAAKAAQRLASTVEALLGVALAVTVRCERQGVLSERARRRHAAQRPDVPLRARARCAPRCTRASAR